MSSRMWASTEPGSTTSTAAPEANKRAEPEAPAEPEVIRKAKPDDEA